MDHLERRVKRRVKHTAYMFLFGGALGVFQCAVLYVYFSGYVYRLYFGLGPTALQIEPRAVDLGEMPIGEERELKVQIRNHARSAVLLSKPNASCGCIDAKFSARRIAAGGSTELTFAIAAPTFPTTIDRQISFTCTDIPGHEWKLRITGRTLASVWAEPAQLSLQLDHAGYARGRIRIRTADSTKVARVAVAAKNAEVNVEHVSHGTNSESYEVSVTASEQGSATLVAYSDNVLLLNVPIRWDVRRVLSVSPARIVIGQKKDGEDNVLAKKIVVVIDHSRADASALKVDAVVPWTRIMGRKRVRSNVVILDIDVQGHQAPPNFRGRILSIKLGEEEIAADVHAIVGEAL